MSLPVRPPSDFPISSLDPEYSPPLSILATVKGSDLPASSNFQKLPQLSPQPLTASQAQSSLPVTNTSTTNGNNVTMGFGVDLELPSSPLSSPTSVASPSTSTTGSVVSKKSNVSAGSEKSKRSTMSKTSTVSKASNISNVSKKRSHNDELDPEVTPPPAKTIKTTNTKITKIKMKPKILTQKKRAPPMSSISSPKLPGTISPPKPAPEPVFKAVFDTATPLSKLVQEPVQEPVHPAQSVQDVQEPIQEPMQEPVKEPTKKPKTTSKKAAPKSAVAPSNRPSRNRKAPERLAEQIEAPKPKPVAYKPASKVFDPEYVTTNANSRLCKADVYHMLINSQAWDSLTTPQRASLIEMLPPTSISLRVLDELAAGKITELKRPRELTVNFNIFRTDVAKFKDDLRNGYLGKTWTASAEEAVKDRAAGLFDAWKDEEAERWWGQKSVGRMD